MKFIHLVIWGNHRAIVQTSITTHYVADAARDDRCTPLFINLCARYSVGQILQMKGSLSQFFCSICCLSAENDADVGWSCVKSSLVVPWELAVSVLHVVAERNLLSE
jgi:hypothetical protein